MNKRNQTNRPPLTRQKRELWDVYNAQGEKQKRTAWRGDPLPEGDFHLVVHAWVRNPRGEYLIQKRASDLELHPGIWATAAGSVLAGENARQGALRELQEEIGVRPAPEELVELFQYNGTDSIVTVWLLKRDVADCDIRLQEEEVSEVAWASPEQVLRMVEAGTFFDYGECYFERLFGLKSSG